MEFNYKNYINILKMIKEKGYEYKRYTEQLKEHKNILLRHDVDIDLFSDKALNILKIEHDMEAISTWFVLPNSKLYNLMDKDIIDFLKIVKKYNNDIGIHLDASIYCTKEEMIEDLKRIKNFYSKYIDFSNIISFHKPNEKILDKNIKIDGYINTYEDRFFKDIAYVSDSNRREFLEEQIFLNTLEKGENLQFLTHPIWWDYTNYEKEEIIHNSKKSIVKTLDNEWNKITKRR